jgi:hypothetical protein
MADCDASPWLTRLVIWLLTACTLPACFGQATGKATIGRRTQVSGGAQINSPYSRYVQIMALFPPAYNPGAHSDYTNFQSNVMTQTDANGLPIVDGVTLEVVWSQVETSAPTSTPCGVATDMCQEDAVGQYHTYGWSYYDSNPSMMYPSSVVPWFAAFGGVKKQVNFILSGINTSSSTNAATPWYVTSSTYIANFPSSPIAYNRQDVVNGATCPSTTVPWTGSTTASYSRTTPLSTVTVTSSNCCGTGNPIQAGDPIWVYGDGDMNSVTGATVLSVTHPSAFTYQSQGSSTTAICLGCAYISAFQSSPVPYEMPYTVAWEAFLAAANLHFSPSYTPQGTNFGPQLGYIRSGTWVGGESFVYCQSTLAALGGPYAYTSSAVWTSDLLNKVNYVKSLTPTLVRYWPIDPGSDPNTMAANAISAGNGRGFNNGFGSQGLSAADYQPGGTGCSTANANWCSLFGTYHSLGVPLELQQISISDETESCVPASNCGTPPKSAGNMRLWLPFAVTHYATTFEMYYLDLALAYDSHYCTPSGTGCVPPSYFANPAFMNTTQQLTWYNDVGRGNAACPSGTTNTTDCYSAVIDAAHGPH